jgi:hypothetical protein
MVLRPSRVLSITSLNFKTFGGSSFKSEVSFPAAAIRLFSQISISVDFQAMVGTELFLNNAIASRIEERILIVSLNQSKSYEAE